jgi:hypothetical protein
MTERHKHRCQNCGESMMKSFEGGKVKLWNRGIVTFEKGRALAKCTACRKMTPVPIMLRGPFSKERLYVKDPDKKKADS